MNIMTTIGNFLIYPARSSKNNPNKHIFFLPFYYSFKQQSFCLALMLMKYGICFKYLFYPINLIFQEAGCQHEAQVDGLKRHEKGCEYRTVKCPLFSCKKSFAIKALADHFDDDSTHDEMRAITVVPVTFTMVLKHGQNPEPNAPKRYFWNL